MSLIGKEIVEFKANAYHKGEFIEVSSEDLKENGASSVFTLRTSLSFVRLNWKIFRTNMQLCKDWV